MQNLLIFSSYAKPEGEMGLKWQVQSFTSKEYYTVTITPKGNTDAVSSSFK